MAKSQTLKKNEIDEFTGKKVQTTSYETLVWTIQFKMSVRGIRNDSTSALGVLIQNIPSITAFNKGGILYFKLTDNSIVQLNNSEYTISSAGQGGKHILESKIEGAELAYKINAEDFKKLNSTPIFKVRI